ncbi:MAG: S8 family serine peptidase [bacterium]
MKRNKTPKTAIRIFFSLLFTAIGVFAFLYAFNSKLVLVGDVSAKENIVEQKSKLSIVSDNPDNPSNFKSYKDAFSNVQLVNENNLKSISNISNRRVEKNGKSYLETVPNDTYYSNSSNNYALPGQLLDSWNLRDINLLPTDEVYPSGWKVTTGSTNTVVAVIDTGIDKTHSDLSSNLWVNPGESGSTTQEGPVPNCTSRGLALDKSCNNLDDDGNGYIDDTNGFNFADSFDANSNGTYTDLVDTNNSDVTDVDGHGTHVSGVIAGRGNNGLGVTGVCWTCKIMALKVINSQGFAYDSDVAIAIHYASVMGAKVINISLGGGGTSTAIDLASQEAFNTYHAVVVTASGNDSGDASDSYPGAAIYAVNVGASYVTNTNNPLSSYSNFGERMDILAPGGQLNQGATQKEGVLSTYMNNQYAIMKGTSMASPHVAGVAALLSDLHRSDITPWGAKEIRYTLLSKATDIVNVPNGYSSGFDIKSGFGKLDALNSVNALNSSVSFLSGDNTNPTVSLNSFANTKQRGNINVIGTVSDSNTYIYTVYFLRASDNSVIMQRSGRGNVTNSNLLTFDTTKIPDGDYKVELRAEDYTGNASISNTVNVSIDNTPPSIVSLTYPSASSYIAATVPNLTWTASTDANGPVTYDLYFNSSLILSGSSANSYQYPTTLLNGSVNTWYIVAKDTFGNTSQSNINQFTIDTASPSLSSIVVSNNSSGVNISFSTNATISGISSYQISLNGGIFTPFTPPYTNNSLPDGTYNYIIRVYSNSGMYNEYSGTFVVNNRKIYLMTKGDFNDDGKVDLSDLSILASLWGQTSKVADANSDGKVDLSDLSILATNWNKSF